MVNSYNLPIKKRFILVSQASNPSNQETEARGSQVPGQSWLQRKTSVSKAKMREQGDSVGEVSAVQVSQPQFDPRTYKMMEESRLHKAVFCPLSVHHGHIPTKCTQRYTIFLMNKQQKEGSKIIGSDTTVMQNNVRYLVPRT